MPKSFDPYMFLTHAAMYCRFGGEVEDREPDEGDKVAYTLLLECRTLVVTAYKLT